VTAGPPRAYRGGVHASGGSRPDLHLAVVVAAGGVVGSLARWAVVEAVPWRPPSLPVATLTVNLLGCLVIGVLLTWWTEGMPPAWWVRPFAAVGVVGGFTTFSTFAVEGVRLLDAGAVAMALSYTVGSVVAGLLLVQVGAYGARRTLGVAGGGSS
jgi:CrcB protein